MKNCWILYLNDVIIGGNWKCVSKVEVGAVALLLWGQRSENGRIKGSL